MNINEIMEIFKDPNRIQTLEIGDKLTAVGFTFVLGMGITFLSLIILKIVIELMSKIIVKTPKESKNPEVTTVEKVAVVEKENDKELIAAITVALAHKLGTSINNIKLTSIKKRNNIAALLKY